LLLAHGLQVEAYASGQDFLDGFVPGRVDCLLLDLNMPGLSGLDMLKVMNEMGTRVPAIVITAYDDPTSRAQCLASGAHAYLRKPLDNQELFGAISEAIDSARL
jgi:FixJ family two-component response regulator